MPLPKGALVLTSTSDMALRVVITVFHVIAVASSVYRFFSRRQAHRLWWDDYSALFAAVVDCIYFTLLWMGSVDLNDKTFSQSVSSNRARFWIIALVSVIIVWASHVAMLLSIARIFPAGKQKRRLCINLTAFLALLFLSLVTCLCVRCTKESNWEYGYKNTARCIQPLAIRIIFSSMDVFTSIILVVIPVVALLFGLPSRNQARQLWTALVASAISFFATATYIVFVFAPLRWEPASIFIRLRTNHLEASISLVMSNLCFCVTYFYLHMRNEDIEAADVDSVLSLTEIELNSSDYEMSVRSRLDAATSNKAVSVRSTPSNMSDRAATTSNR